MQVQVQVQDGDDKARATLVLDDADLARLRGGEAISFEVDIAGSKQRCQLLQKGGRSDATGLDHRLFVDAGAINAVSIGGMVAPMFEGVPFYVSLKGAPDLALATGPVRLSPGVVYERIGASPGPKPTSNDSLKLRAGMVALALVSFLIAYALRDFRTSLFGFGAMGCGFLWVAFRGPDG